MDILVMIMMKMIKYNIVYKTKKEPHYQYGFWEDFISIDECDRIYENLKKNKNKIYNIILLDNNNKETLLYET